MGKSLVVRMMEVLLLHRYLHFNCRRQRGSPIFSRGHGWRADGADIYGYEWWPSQNDWDTVWVVEKGDTGRMPYYPDFVGFAQQNCYSLWRLLHESS